MQKACGLGRAIGGGSEELFEEGDGVKGSGELYMPFWGDRVGYWMGGIWVGLLQGCYQHLVLWAGLEAWSRVMWMVGDAEGKELAV